MTGSGSAGPALSDRGAQHERFCRSVAFGLGMHFHLLRLEAIELAVDHQHICSRVQSGSIPWLAVVFLDRVRGVRVGGVDAEAYSGAPTVVRLPRSVCFSKAGGMPLLGHLQRHVDQIVAHSRHFFKSFKCLFN